MAAVNSLPIPALRVRFRERVQSDDISYFGACGGTLVASCMPRASNSVAATAAMAPAASLALPAGCRERKSRSSTYDTSQSSAW